MSDHHASSFRFTQTPHQPKQQCTARLTQTIWIEQLNDSIQVFIPCSLTVHRVTTRHLYIGTTEDGAPLTVHWRDK